MYENPMHAQMNVANSRPGAHETDSLLRLQSRVEAMEMSRAADTESQREQMHRITALEQTIESQAKIISTYSEQTML